MFVVLDVSLLYQCLCGPVHFLQLSLLMQSAYRAPDSLCAAVLDVAAGWCRFYCGCFLFMKLKRACLGRVCWQPCAAVVV